MDKGLSADGYQWQTFFVTIHKDSTFLATTTAFRWQSTSGPMDEVRLNGWKWWKLAIIINKSRINELICKRLPTGWDSLSGWLAVGTMAVVVVWVRARDKAQMNKFCKRHRISFLPPLHSFNHRNCRPQGTIKLCICCWLAGWLHLTPLLRHLTLSQFLHWSRDCVGDVGRFMNRSWIYY